MFPWNWKVPFGGQNENTRGPFQPEQFQKYVDQMINQMFPPQYKNMMKNPDLWNQASHTSESPSSSPFQETVLETHDDVYVRLRIKETDWLQRMKISYTRSQCFISDSPDEGDTWTIELPALVKKKGAQAVYKNDILEIKIPKSLEWQETEIELPQY